MATSSDDLGDEPAHHADCCVALSKPLIQAMVDQLLRSPALILSVGSGTGLLENLLLQHAMEMDGSSPLDLYGIEVPTCVNKYLPEERSLRVASSRNLYTDAMFASAMIFVYPRQVSLVSEYIEVGLNGALERLLWLGHRSDWSDTMTTISAGFAAIQYVEDPGIAEYELLVIATKPKRSRKKLAEDC